ncbi:uncharacterized protein LOC109616494 isoform X2 [Esox lucius]|uniref:uncharacterized protein LOC109616494 isoform X2 n=1 Tax=Esox lucius TaxID=8010 RepID=UPI0014771A4A|nr:uncharacterized protein LOC109616494 isoform X2 [Esox lucius]
MVFLIISILILKALYFIQLKLNGGLLLSHLLYLEMYPAKPSGPSNVTEGTTIHFKCQTNSITISGDMVHFYLCKDGVGIQMAPMKKGAESIFLLKEVKKQDSGKYSCVYSKCKHPVSQVKSTGDYLVLWVNRDEDVEGGQKTKDVFFVPILLSVSILLLVLLWSCLGIVKQKICSDHRPSEIQDMGQTYSGISSVPVDVTEIPLDVEEAAYSVIDNWRGLRPSLTQRQSGPMDSQHVSVMGSDVHHSQKDPTGEEAKCSSLQTTAIRPETQVENATYAQVIKTKKKGNEPVYSLLMKK